MGDEGALGYPGRGVPSVPTEQDSCYDWALQGWTPRSRARGLGRADKSVVKEILCQHRNFKRGSLAAGQFSLHLAETGGFAAWGLTLHRNAVSSQELVL